MADIAHEMTDKYIKQIEYRLKKEYEKAEKEVAEKAKKHFERFEAKDKEMRERRDRKEITKKEYNTWRTNQLLVNKRWNDMRDTLAQDFANTNSIARSITSEFMPMVYALNHNFGTYQIEHETGMSTAYTLYSRETVESLMRDNPQLLPNPGKATENRIYNGLDVRYNRQQLQSVAMQGVLQGESIPKIAARLAREVGEKNRNAAIRNARTMMTCAENKGRMDSYKRAQDMGIETNKRWLATNDNRTRDWHASLNEISIPVDQPFENEYGKIMYPGDPGAKPANVYNCRCTLVADIKHVKSFSERLKEDKAAKRESFDAWTNRKGRGLFGTSPIYDSFEKKGFSGVAYNRPERLTTRLTEQEIIDKVGGVDTAGSCVSQCLAYLGNKAGFDVRDLRADEGTTMLQEDFAAMRIVKFKGVTGVFEESKGRKSVDFVDKYIQAMMPEKEYILGSGDHAAIVKQSNGVLQYLELQGDKPDNGWVEFDEDPIDTILSRFHGNLHASNYLIEARSLMRSKDFKEMLGYINRA